MTPCQYQTSLGPVVNILAIFSNANILKNKRIKNITHQRYRLSVIDFDVIFDQGTENKKRRKNDQTGTQASIGPLNSNSKTMLVGILTCYKSDTKIRGDPGFLERGF